MGPTSKRTSLGQLYRILGEGTVVHSYGDIVSVQVRKSWSELKRNDLVGPTIPVEVEVEVETPKGDIEGFIVSRLTVEATLAGTREVVFLDQGRSDGLRVGDSIYVYEQRDPWSDVKSEDEDLPPAVIGRVVVVRVDEDQSTGVIVDADRPIQVGNRVASRID